MVEKIRIVRRRKRECVYVGIFSVFLAVVLIVGSQIENNNMMSWTLSTLLKIIFSSVLLFLIFFTIVRFLLSEKTTDTSFKDKKLCKWKWYAVIVVVWGCAYLALFPGIYDYDSISQTLQFLVTGYITGHHPVLHSFLISAFMQLGKTLFQSYEIGLGIFTFLQLLFLAYVATEVAFFLKNRGYKILFYLSMIFYAFFPLHHVMVMWDTKDIIFSAFFVLVSMDFIKMLESNGVFWENKRNCIRFILLVLFMCMFRNNGVYAIVLTVPISFFVSKTYWKRIVLLIGISVGLFLSYQNLLLPSLGVEQGNVREMLSIPCQQMAKVYVETPDVYSQEEKEMLFELIPEQNLKDYAYRPMIADAVKNYLNSDVLSDHLFDYGKLYVEVGLRSPRKYIEAFLANSLGFWYPNKGYPDERMFHPYTEFEMADPELFKGDFIYLERYSMFPQYEKVLKYIVGDAHWTDIPVISVFFVPGTYFVIMIFAIMMVLLRKKYKYLMTLGFWMAFWFTLLISPVALVRYAYPVILCLPLMGYMIVENKN